MRGSSGSRPASSLIASTSARTRLGWPTEIVERDTARWQIEVCFRELKQHLGFGAGRARSRHAVERVTPFAAYVYSLTVLWARTALRRVDRVPRIKRPWYRDKTGLSLADLLHVARREVLD